MTLFADSEEKKKRILTFKTKCLRKVLHISDLKHKTNDWVHSKINFLVSLQEPFLATVKRRKPPWFGHVTSHDSLSKSKTILQGTLEGGRRCGQQRKCWMANIKEWTSLPMPDLLTTASCRKDWNRISAELSLMSPWRPNRSRDWTELNTPKGRHHMKAMLYGKTQIYIYPCKWNVLEMKRTTSVPIWSASRSEQRLVFL